MKAALPVAELELEAVPEEAEPAVPVVTLPRVALPPVEPVALRAV